jgi:hypothetical protein
MREFMLEQLVFVAYHILRTDRRRSDAAAVEMTAANRTTSLAARRPRVRLRLGSGGFDLVVRFIAMEIEGRTKA